MRQIKEEFPPTDVPFGEQGDTSALFDSVRGLVRVIQNIKADYTEVINYNAVTEIAAAVRPTPELGRMVVWSVTGAVVGQPTHYLVYNFNGAIVTFASEELA